MRKPRTYSSGADDADSSIDEDNSDWQTTYLDTVTILLAFFIILSSLADSETSIAIGTEIIDPVENAKLTTANTLFYPIVDLNNYLEQNMKAEIDQGLLSLETGDYEIRMMFSGSSFYKLGEAELLPGGKAIIQRIVERLATLERSDFKIDVEGHTDSAPIRTVRFANNWELSSARASSVVRYFLEAGIDATKLKASGYADTFLLHEDKDERGNYIPENQNKNRRIVIRLYYN